MTSTGHDRRRYYYDRSRPTTLYTIYTIIQSPQNTLNTPGRHLPVTTGYFITKTGHCRWLYMQFTQSGQVPQNTLKIHGCVLWHLPVTTGHFIIKTGHCRRLPSWVKSLRIHWKYTVVYYDFYRSRPTTLLSFHTRIGAPVDRRRYLILRPGCTLPTIRIIVPSSPRVSVWPNITVRTISEWYLVVGHSLIERVTIFFIFIYTRKVLLPHSKHYNQHPIYFPWCNYTLISLRVMSILGEHSEFKMIFTSEQRSFLQVFTYIHTKCPSAS